MVTATGTAAATARAAASGEVPELLRLARHGHGLCHRQCDEQDAAAATATSHVRASVGKAPAHFKEVIDAALGTSYARMTWADSVARVAKEYREQVLLDYECFFEYANSTVGPL